MFVPCPPGEPDASTVSVAIVTRASGLEELHSPARATITRVSTPDELAALGRTERLACIVIDALERDSGAVRDWIRCARAAGGPICVVDAPVVALELDCLAVDRCDAPARIVQLVRYALGEPMRDAVRVPYRHSLAAGRDALQTIRFLGDGPARRGHRREPGVELRDCARRCSAGAEPGAGPP